MRINLIVRRLYFVFVLLLAAQLLSAQIIMITPEQFAEVNQLNIDANTAIQNQDYPKAVQLWTKAGELCRGYENFVGALTYDIQVHYYTQYFLQQDVKPIIERMKIAVVQCDSSNELMVRATETIGTYYFYLYKLDSAQHYYTQSQTIQIAISGTVHPTVARLYYHLGNVHSYQHNTTVAAIYFEEAYKIYQKIENPPPYDYGNLLFSMGNNYSQEGQFNQAELYLNEVRPIYEGLYGKNSPNLGSLVHSLAIIKFSQAKNFASKKLILEALDIYKQDETTHQVAIVQLYDMLGRVFILDKNYSEALACYKATEKSYLALYGENSEVLAAVYMNLGATYKSMNDTAQSMAYFNKSIAIGRRQKLSTILAQTYSVMGKVIDVSYYQYAFTTLVPSFQEVSFKANPSLADVQKGCHNYRFLVQALNGKLSYWNAKKSRTLDSMQYTMAKTALDLVEKSDSICKYILAEHVGQNDQKEYLSIFSTIYMQGQQVCLDLYELTQKKEYLAKGFYFSEQYKSFLLKDALKEGDALDFGGVPIAIRKHYKTLKKSLATQKAELLELQANKDTLSIGLKSKTILETDKTLANIKEQLAKDYPKYHQLQHENLTIQSTIVQEKLLDDQTALIEYMVGDSVTIIHVLTNKKIAVYQTLQQDKLNYLLKKFLQQLKNPNSAKVEVFAKNAHELYKVLLQQPLAALSPDIKKLIIVPDKNLVNLPFDVLLTDEGGQPTFPYEQLPYLLRKYTLNYSYSAALLLENKNRKRSNRTGILSLAASYDTSVVQSSMTRMPYIKKIRKKLEVLPYAEKEVKGLEGRYNGTFLYAKEANERRFKQLVDSFSIIHLALHGLTNKAMPMFSGLLFSENLDTLEDNMLFLHEISNLDIQTDMVVLSACETGVGRYTEGEGAMSLARAFMYAGTASVVMSLWAVNDQSTEGLMAAFYKKLSEGLPKDEALRQAKLHYLDRQKGRAAHPAYWAAFVHLGDAQSIAIPKKGNKLWLYLGLSGLGLAALMLVVRWRLVANAKREV